MTAELGGVAGLGVDVLGVDGGQSAVRVRHSRSRSTEESSGVSHLEGDTVAAVADSIVVGWAQLGSPTTRRVVLGLTTAPVDPGELNRLASIVGDATGAAEVWVCDDTVTAHVGALSGEHGVSLTAGTGVACFGTGDATSVVVDGHGYLLGDDGGGFWIGREGLRAVLRQADGRGEPTALTARAIDSFGEVRGLPVRIHGMPRAVNEIAHFAIDVLELSERDELAADILLRAARVLGESVAAAVTAVKGLSPVAVALGGRLLAESSPLLPLVHSAIAAATSPGIGTVPVRTADASPLDGALLLGSGELDSTLAPHVHQWRRESR